MLILAFFLMVAVVFSIIAVVTRPTKEQNAVQRRITEIVVSQAGREPAEIALPNHLKVTQASSFKLLDTLVASTWVSRRLQILIVQGQTQIAVGSFIMMVFAAAVVGFAAAWFLLGALLPSVGIACVAAYVPLGYLQFKRSRRIAAFNAALPDCIEMCARSLRVGNSIVAAIDIVATESPEPAKTEFAEVFKKQNYGLPLRDALLQMLDRVPSMDLQVFVTGILVQKDTGGNLPEILDRIVFVIKERLRIKREIRTHTAQGRLTGWILCLLPPGMLVLINLMNPGYSDVLFDMRSSATRCSTPGTGLLLVGAFLIRQIVNGIEV